MPRVEGQDNAEHGPTMRARVRALVAVGSALALPTLLAPTAAHAATLRRRVVASGETWEIAEITRLDELVVEEGAVLTAAEGYLLSLTLDGVETGSVLDGTYGTTTLIVAGTYRGDVVLTPAAEHTESFAGTTFHLRQAVYVGSAGVVTGNSVLSAVRGGRLTDASAKNVSLSSTGQAFNRFYVAEGAAYALTGSRVRFDGNGRCDFATYGAAVTGKGEGTRVVVDGADVDNRGAVRTGLIAYDGANVIVKNSRIRTREGKLPDDHVLSMGPNMMTVPWMLGLRGKPSTPRPSSPATPATAATRTVAARRTCSSAPVSTWPRSPPSPPAGPSPSATARGRPWPRSTPNWTFG